MRPAAIAIVRYRRCAGDSQGFWAKSDLIVGSDGVPLTQTCQHACAGSSAARRLPFVSSISLVSCALPLRCAENLTHALL